MRYANTPSQPTRTRHVRRPAGGFSVMETLLAMGVFAVGFVSVASIFPVATLMQKQTTEDVLGQQVGRNAAAMMRARPYLHADLNALIPADTRVNPIMDNGSLDHWRLNDRAYFLVRMNFGYHPAHTAEVAGSGFNRGYYWVPLARRTVVPTSADDWQVFVFVLRGGGSPHPALGYDRVGIDAPPFNGWANYDGFTSPKWNVPGVYGMPVTVTGTNQFNFTSWNKNLYGKEAASNIKSTEHFEVQVGDQVLDNNGIIHTVNEADPDWVRVQGTIPTANGNPTILWYGRPGWEGKPSPTKAIIVLTDVVRP